MTYACTDCSKCGKCYNKISRCSSCGEEINLLEQACPNCGEPITEQERQEAKKLFMLKKKQEREALFAAIRSRKSHDLDKEGIGGTSP